MSASSLKKMSVNITKPPVRHNKWFKMVTAALVSYPMIRLQALVFL